MQQVAQIMALPSDRRTGEPDDLPGLLAPLIGPGIRLACAMLHDAQTAEDVVQDASVIAWRKLSAGAEPSNLKSWFLGVVANECRNARRHKWTSSVVIGLQDRHHVGPADERVLRGTDLRRALVRLAHSDRLVVVLFFYLDLPLDEVAAIAGVSVAAARARLYRAIRRLRPDLEVEEALL